MGWTPHGRQKILSPPRWPPSSPRFWLGLVPLSSGSWRSSPGRGSVCSRTPPVVLSAALQSVKTKITRRTKQQAMVRETDLKSEITASSFLLMCPWTTYWSPASASFAVQYRSWPLTSSMKGSKIIHNFSTDLGKVSHFMFLPLHWLQTRNSQ